MNTLSSGGLRSALAQWEASYPNLRKASFPSLGYPQSFRGPAQPAIRDRVGTPMPTLSPQSGFAATVRGWIDSIAADLWFTPGQPVATQAPPGTEPRMLDYPVGINIMYVPRSEEDITFSQLRSLGDLWDLLRLVIETRKDQVCAIEWKIQPVRKTGETANDYNARAKEDTKPEKLKQAFLFPNGRDTFSSWIRTVLEEMLVLDAVAILPVTDGLQRPQFEILDGATIKRLIDNRGRTPTPADGIAYQQVIKGIPAVDFKADQLFYFRRNIRAHKLYGMGPVEQVTWTINFAIRRALYKMAWYTEGNIPEAFIQVPAEWGLDQVRTFSEWFNSLLAGQVDVRRKAFFLPGVSGKDSIIFPKQDTLKDDMDEWLIRVACYALSVSPQPFMREMNRATAQTAQEAARAEGLAPILTTLTEWLTALVQGPLGEPQYEFKFSQDIEADPLQRAQRQSLQIRNGIKSPDEVRDENGDDPIGVGPGIVTAAGFVELVTAVDQSEQTLENMAQPQEPGANGQNGQNGKNGKKGKPGAGGDAKGKGATGGNAKKVTAADAWESTRGKRRLSRTQGLLERFLAEQRLKVAQRLGHALDERRANKVMGFVEEAGVELKK